MFHVYTLIIQLVSRNTNHLIALINAYAVHYLPDRRHEAFCLAYKQDRNGIAAYKHAEYKLKNDCIRKSKLSLMLINVKFGVPQKI